MTTTVPKLEGSLPSKGAQISYNDKDSFYPSDQGFLLGEGAQISSPLGGREGGSEKREYQAPKSIPAARRLTLKSERSFKNSPNRITNADRINSFLIRSGLDYMNRAFHENKKMVSVQDLTSHLFTLITDRLKPSSDYEAATGGERHVFTFDQCERWSMRAAEYAVDVWTPDHFEKQAQRGAKGGRNSKRKPQYTYADFLKVKHLTHAEAAQVLHVHVSTIRRMRDAFREPQALAGLDHLLPTAEAPEPGPDIDLEKLLTEL